MEDRIKELLARAENIQNEIMLELQKRQEQLYYYIKQKRILFEPEVKRLHRELVMPLHQYLREAKLSNILTAPIIWFCAVPAVFIDLVVSLYMHVCFPVYGIPKVKRSEYIIIDHQYLAYLNIVEKINCVFCGYFNGVINYVQEVAARTEQHWCPIKHAHALKTLHSRYANFLDYGDAEKYRSELKKIRQAYDDLH